MNELNQKGAFIGLIVAACIMIIGLFFIEGFKQYGEIRNMQVKATMEAGDKDSTQQLLERLNRL